MSDEKAQNPTPAATDASRDSVFFATNGGGWDTAADAQAEFRQRQLDSDKWAVVRSPRGDGFCIMTFRAIVEMKRKAEQDANNQAAVAKIPMKYHHVRIGTNADADKKDTMTLPIGLNGMFTSLMLNTKCILSEAQIEILENARTENWVPLPDGGQDGKTFVRRGMKDRVNFSILGPATQKEWQDYQNKNKTRFDAFVVEQAAKERTDAV